MKPNCPLCDSDRCVEFNDARNPARAWRCEKCKKYFGNSDADYALYMRYGSERPVFGKREHIKLYVSKPNVKTT